MHVLPESMWYARKYNTSSLSHALNVGTELIGITGLLHTIQGVGKIMAKEVEMAGRTRLRVLDYRRIVDRRLWYLAESGLGKDCDWCRRKRDECIEEVSLKEKALQQEPYDPHILNFKALLALCPSHRLIFSSETAYHRREVLACVLWAGKHA